MRVREQISVDFLILKKKKIVCVFKCFNFIRLANGLASSVLKYIFA